MIKASEFVVYFAVVAHHSSDRLCFQCSVATGGPWLPDWMGHLAIHMSLAVLVIPIGIDHTEMTIFEHLAFFFFWEPVTSSGITGAHGM